MLDLRGNPGGLLDQAARVADKFIADGPIVATVGNPSEGREEKVAHGDGTEPNYPIALLVNGSSASASEIVAGAMKNHDRAVIIGETSLRQGERPARLQRPARQGRAQADDRAVPDRAGRRLDPGRRRHARRRARPDDGRRQGDGSHGRPGRDPPGARSVAQPLERAGARGRASRSRPSATICPRRSAATCASAAATPTTSSRWTSRSSSRATSSPHVRAGQAARSGPAGQGVHRRDARGGAREGAAELKAMGVDWSDAPAGRRRGHPAGAAADRRREGRDRPPEQRGHRRRADGAQGHRHEQGDADALPPRRR